MHSIGINTGLHPSYHTITLVPKESQRGYINHNKTRFAAITGVINLLLKKLHIYLNE